MDKELEKKVRLVLETLAVKNTTREHPTLVNEELQAIHQAYEATRTLDNHLRTYLPHDGKYRKVEFDVAINPNDTLEFKERNLMTGTEWYRRFAKYFEEAVREGDPADAQYELQDITYLDDFGATDILNIAKKAAGLE